MSLPVKRAADSDLAPKCVWEGLPEDAVELEFSDSEALLQTGRCPYCGEVIEWLGDEEFSEGDPEPESEDSASV